jgi:UDP-N-acetylmuramyl pentapeptide phosphotransferase/UDP-N-acetylglucosamine-1-phosphate transferase
VSAAPVVGLLGCLIAAGALGFPTHNWPPAKIFMGDAGSTVIGFLLATAPCLRRRNPLRRRLATGCLFSGLFLSGRS